MTGRGATAAWPVLLAAALLAACGGPAGTLPECTTVSDCPPFAATECAQAVCLRGTCAVQRLAEGTRVGDQPYCGIRFCDAAGSVQWYSDPPPCLPEIFSPPRPHAPVESGETVALQGRNLREAVVRLGGAVVRAVASLDGTALSFTPPPSIAGYQSLEVQTPHGLFLSGFEYTALRPAGRALSADGDLSDWPWNYLVAANSVAPSWSASDVLSRLYLAYDRDGLSVAIAGGTSTAPANGLVIYIDTQVTWLPHAGVNDMTTLTDATNPLSDACASSLKVDPSASFYPQACAGTVGMASVAAGQGLPATGSAGVRWLSPADGFDWRLDGSGGSLATVATSTSPEAVELFLPWSTLKLDPYPADGTVIGLATLIVGPDGQAVSNELLQYTQAPGTIVGFQQVLILW